MLPAAPLCQVHHCGKVFVGLVNGQVQIFRRDHTVNWDLNSPATLTIGTDPECCLLPTSGALYTASGQKILMVDAWANAVIRSFMANGEQVGGETPSPSVLEGSVMSLNSQAASTAASMANLGSMVSHMAVCGIGLWVALHHSSTVSLYHTESFIHMQDINIASNVSRALGGSNKRSIYVTALAAAKGLLWVGTNVGIALTIPLPRLEGVPIISGKANISYHAHFGPVRMFLPLQQKVHTSEPVMARKHVSVSSQVPALPETEPTNAVQTKPFYKKQLSESGISSGPPTPTSLNKQFSSPVLRSRSVTGRDVVASRKSSKTLPRGFTLGPGSESSGDSVFGLYQDLMNVDNYECDSTNNLESSSKDIHNSDPEMDTIEHRIGTLDRRVAFKSNRPRSLELSSWSVESKASSQTTSSSDGSQKTSPSISRTASCASDSNTSESSWISSRTSSSTMTKTRTLTQEPSSTNTGVTTKETKTKHETVQRTVTTLMGGRGYIQWRGTHLDKNKGSHLAQVNNSDAYLVIWDHKL